MSASVAHASSASVVSIRPRPSKSSKAPRKAAGTSKAAIARVRLRRALSLALAGVLVASMVVSLPHLANGISTITQGPAWEGWALAIAIDAGMLIAEALALVDERRMGKACKPYVYGTLAASGGLNVLAMTAHANTGFALAMGTAFGIAIPAAYFVVTKILTEGFRD